MFPYDRIISIDKTGKLPVYRQIAVAVISAIAGGVLKAGTRLPSGRELAGILGVHRKTVVAAYAELEAQGWISAVPRKYVAVSEHIPVLKPREWSTEKNIPPFGNDFALPFRSIADPIPEPGKAVAVFPEVVIDDGRPDVRLSPIEELLRTYRSYTSRKHATRDAQFGTERGTAKLREEMAKYLSETRGLNVTPENILVTHGAQMGIYLAARLLIGPGAAIVVGKPNYPLANQTFAEMGAQVLEISMDENGLDTAAIGEICQGEKITAVYVIPHHHYPTTATLSADRRMELLELSRRHAFAIIEDDYDYDYHYASSPYLPLASASHAGNVVYIGSFSKMLDPSLRIGFMVAPKNFIGQAAAFRKMVDVGGDGYMQNALAALIRDGELKRHLKKAKKTYHWRRDLLHALLREKLDGQVSYALPDGGMAIWVTVRSDLPVARLSSGTKLKITQVDEEHNAFRFGFASMDEKELEQAVDLLRTELLGFGNLET